MNWRAAWQILRFKESATAMAVNRRALGRPVAPMERFDQFAKEAYARNVIAFRCIKEIGEAVGAVPFGLFQGEDEAKTPNEITERLKRPNPMQSWRAWVSHVVGYYLIAGNSYMEAVSPVSGPPKELYSLRPDRMSVVPGASGVPEGYVYKIGGDTVTFASDPLTGLSPIRHMKTFHPLNDWYGMSPVQAAATGINQFNESGVWNQNLLLRGASRRGALELQAQDGHFRTLGDTEYQKLSKRLEEQYSGPDNVGRPFFFEGGLKWVDTSFSPQDMDWINGKHTSARDICSAFGFPCQLLGIPGDNTYSNYKEARQALYENTVMPLTNLLLGELNAWYCPQFGDGLELRADEDQVLALAPRRESLWTRVSAADFLTYDEKRAALGYEPHVPDGNPAHDLYQPATMLPLGFDVPENATVEKQKAWFTKELEAEGVPPLIVKALVVRAFERQAEFLKGNGKWRDDA